jgi:hypothetical protein
MNAASRFFDTTVLLYLLSGDPAKADAAEMLVASGGIVSVQVLNEFASLATRKLRMLIPRYVRYSERFVGFPLFIRSRSSRTTRDSTPLIATNYPFTMPWSWHLLARPGVHLSTPKIRRMGWRSSASRFATRSTLRRAQLRRNFVDVSFERRDALGIVLCCLRWGTHDLVLTPE